MFARTTVKITSRKSLVRISVSSYRYSRIHTLQKLFQYRHAMADGLQVDPFQDKPAARKIAGCSHASQLENQTRVIPDEVLGPLVRAALEYVDDFADYLLDTFDAVENIRKGGCDFEYRANRYLRESALSAYELNGTRFQRGLPSLRQLNKELCYLQTACFVVIAFATGMRLSEILSLRTGCCEIQKEPGQPDLVWLRSRVFKLQGTPEGRRAKWLAGPVCARAVAVLERLGRPVRRRLKAPYPVASDSSLSETTRSGAARGPYDGAAVEKLRSDGGHQGHRWAALPPSSPHVPPHVCAARCQA